MGYELVVFYEKKQLKAVFSPSCAPCRTHRVLQLLYIYYNYCSSNQILFVCLCVCPAEEFDPVVVSAGFLLIAALLIVVIVAIVYCCRRRGLEKRTEEQHHVVKAVHINHHVKAWELLFSFYETEIRSEILISHTHTWALIHVTNRTVNDKRYTPDSDTQRWLHHSLYTFNIVLYL